LQHFLYQLWLMPMRRRQHRQGPGGGNRINALFLCLIHQHRPLLRFTGNRRFITGIEQGQPADAWRGLTIHFECHPSSHRMAGQQKFCRRIAQYFCRHGADRILILKTDNVHLAITALAQCLGLPAPYNVVTQQAAQQINGFHRNHAFSK